ncbi:MAG: FliH/SctL family protein [Cellvibrionaceae bacterium]
MSKKLPNVIAAEHLQDVLPWQLPSMDGSDNVVPSAEKELRDRAHRADEVIEDVADEESLEFSPITAEELQEITNAAEREGFELGQQRGLEAGHKEGHEAGYNAGMEQAQSEAKEILERQVSQLLQIAESLVLPIEQQQSQLQQTLLQFVTSLTEQVIERELIQDSAHILSCVKQAMTALPVGAQDIRVFLNPDDLALVESYSEEFDKGWKFQGDSQLLPGGCRIQTRDSLVDFSAESKMKAMFAQFLDHQLTDASLLEQQKKDLEDISSSDSALLAKENVEKRADESSEEAAQGDGSSEAMSISPSEPSQASTPDAASETSPQSSAETLRDNDVAADARPDINIDSDHQGPPQ